MFPVGIIVIAHCPMSAPEPDSIDDPSSKVSVLVPSNTPLADKVGVEAIINADVPVNSPDPTTVPVGVIVIEQLPVVPAASVVPVPSGVIVMAQLPSRVPLPVSSELPSSINRVQVPAKVPAPLMVEEPAPINREQVPDIAPVGVLAISLK